MRKPGTGCGRRFACAIALVGVTILLFGAIGVHAQQVTGRVLGTVLDSSGAVVPNAQIAITNQDTGVVLTTTSTSDGLYNDPQVPSGTYTVEVTAPGFGPAEVKNVVVTVASDTRVDLKLVVGSVSQNVLVTEAVPQVDTTSSAVGSTVDEQKLEDLPLNGRNWTDLTLMQAGISQMRQNLVTAGMQGTVYSAHGADLRSNTYMLDGAITQNIFATNNSSIINTSLGLDGIQEYKIITVQPSAEYGLLTGAQTVIVSKGGSNTWHGDLFESLRNNAMDARNFFDPVGSDGTSLVYPGHRLPPFQRNNFGGAVGGPIRKDKTFFWGIYEGLRQRRGTTITTNTLPKGCYYDQNDVFHNFVPAVIDNSVNNPAYVASTKLACAGTAGAAGSLIRVPALTQQLDVLFPAPNVSGGTFNYTYPFIEPSAENMGQIRIDQNFSPKDSAFLRYTHDDADQTTNTAYPALNYILHSSSIFLTVSETHTISSTVLNTFRGSFSRTQLVPGYGLGAGTTSVPVTSAYYPFPSVSPGSGVTGFGPNPGPSPIPGNGNVQDIITGSDDIFWTKGKHAMKFGVLYNHFQENLNYALFGNGAVTFGSTAGFFGINAGNTGTSAVAGVPDYSNLNWISSAAPYQSNQSRSFIYHTLGFYGQDDFRVLPRLTLNLGLRYEFYTAPRTINGQQAYGTFLSNVFTDPTYANLGTPVSSVISNPSLHNFSPRIGFAWDIFGDGKTALRGGAGIYYTAGMWGDLLTYNTVSQPPIANQLQVPNVKSVPTVPLQLPLDNMIPALLTTPGAISFGPRFIVHDTNQPTLATYDVFVDRQLPWNMAISAGYVGSRGWHLYTSREFNPVIPAGYDASGVPYQCAAPNGEPTVAPNVCSVTAPTPPRPNPNIGLMLGDYAVGESWFYSAEVVISKKMSNGLQFQSAFTHERMLDNGIGQSQADSAINNQVAGNPGNVDKGVSLYNVPNNWRFNAIYHIPDIKSDNFAAKFEHGWQMSSIVSVQSGQEVNPVLGLFRSLAPASITYSDRPSISSTFNTNANTGNINQWWDPSMFNVPAMGTYGNAPRNALVGPNFRNIDFSVTKDTKLPFLGESGGLQFRFDAFNILNRANFGVPNATLISSSSATLGATATNLTNLGLIPAATSGALNPNFGKITSTISNPRQIQLTLRIAF